MLDLLVGGYVPGTKIQISFFLLTIIVFVTLILTAIILTWILQREEKRLIQQVIDAVHAQLQS